MTPLTAEWNESLERYEVTIAPDTQWTSEDGDEWYTDDGRLVDSPQFTDAAIELQGGPRDGETVA